MNYSYCKTVFPITFRDSWETILRRIKNFPSEVFIGPELEYQDNEQNDDGAEVDEGVFAPVGFEDEVVLRGERRTFHKRVPVMLHQLIGVLSSKWIIKLGLYYSSFKKRPMQHSVNQQ